MIYEISQLLSFSGNYSLKDTINLILFLQDCNTSFDDLKQIKKFIENCNDENIKDLINQSKDEYIA